MKNPYRKGTGSYAMYNAIQKAKENMKAVQMTRDVPQSRVDFLNRWEDKAASGFKGGVSADQLRQFRGLMNAQSLKSVSPVRSSGRLTGYSYSESDFERVDLGYGQRAATNAKRFMEHINELLNAEDYTNLGDKANFTQMRGKAIGTIYHNILPNLEEGKDYVFDENTGYDLKTESDKHLLARIKFLNIDIDDPDILQGVQEFHENPWAHKKTREQFMKRREDDVWYRNIKQMLDKTGLDLDRATLESLREVMNSSAMWAYVKNDPKYAQYGIDVWNDAFENMVDIYNEFGMKGVREFKTPLDNANNGGRERIAQAMKEYEKGDMTFDRLKEVLNKQLKDNALGGN